MTRYSPPVDDFLFVYEHVLDDAVPKGDLDRETMTAVLEEAGKIASEVLTPLNRLGDGEHPVLEDGHVHVSDHWRAALRSIAEGGWIGTSQNPEFGGQGLPVFLNSAVLEIFCAANMAFGLSMALTEGAVETLEHCASDDLKQRFIPRMLSGEWMGTMNLTEPQAGSDLSALTTKAVPYGDHYKLAGQKVFISFGDHDIAENIIQLVLARVPDAPDGVKGISLFLVPKYLVNEDGSLGAHNDVVAVSLEDKMGLHGSPTVTLRYGENGGAVGYLLGEENHGLEYMFIMMNRERHMCGIQAIGVAEMALQHAVSYAGERMQGVPVGGRAGDPIIEHPDVMRMILTMKSYTEAMRTLACTSAAMMDAAGLCDDAALAEDFQKISELLTPVVKAWSTDVGFEVASLGMQVFGGLGYMEPTGVAQLLRDVRITSIYEGTNGIQANDLVFRKVLRDDGVTALRMLQWMDDIIGDLPGGTGLVGDIQSALTYANEATRSLLVTGKNEPRRVAAIAAPYLRLMGTVWGGYYLVKGAEAAHALQREGYAGGLDLQSKIDTARFYVYHILIHSSALSSTVINGSHAVLTRDRGDS